MSIEVNSTSTEIVEDTLEITQGITPADVSTETSAYVEVVPAEYVLSSGGTYSTGALTGTIPEWVTTAIQQEINTGGSIGDIVDDLNASMDVLEAGIAQNLTSINTSNTSINNRVDTVVSAVDSNRAESLNLIATKVTDAEATTIAVDQITASFGADVDAHISSVTAAYASANLAYASDHNILSATLGDTTARVTSNEFATVEAAGWAAGASKLVTSPSGAVTGWEFADGSVDTDGSVFKISADKFSLVNADGSASPLVVDATDPNNVSMEFTGKVTLAGLGIDSTTTTIDGGKVTAGTLSASKITAETVWIGGEVSSTDFTTITAGNGFRLKSNALSTTEDPTIYGAYIKGGTIEGTTMESSTMKVRDLLVLTDTNRQTRVIFGGKGIVAGTSAAATMTLPIYCHDTNNTSNQLVSGSTGSLLTCYGTTSTTHASGYAGSGGSTTTTADGGSLLLDASNTFITTNDAVVSLTVNGTIVHTVLSSANLPSSGGTTTNSKYGIEFTINRMDGGDYTDYCSVWISSVTQLVGLPSVGQLAIKLTSGTSTVSTHLRPISIVVSNV